MVAVSVGVVVRGVLMVVKLRDIMEAGVVLAGKIRVEVISDRRRQELMSIVISIMGIIIGGRVGMGCRGGRGRMGI
jgi:hypothetical protein